MAGASGDDLVDGVPLEDAEKLEDGPTSPNPPARASKPLRRSPLHSLGRWSHHCWTLLECRSRRSFLGLEIGGVVGFRF